MDEKTIAARNADMRRMAGSGWTLSQTADLYGITKARVHQILHPKLRRSHTFKTKKCPVCGRDLDGTGPDTAGCPHCNLVTQLRQIRGDLDWHDIRISWRSIHKKTWTSPHRVLIEGVRDLFGPLADDSERDDVLKALQTSKPYLTLLVTTNLVSQMRDYVVEWVRINGPLPDNVLFGTTVRNQAEADDARPALTGVPARTFLLIDAPSGEIDLAAWLGESDASPFFDGRSAPPVSSSPALDWIVVKPTMSTDLTWVERIAEQADVAGVPAFVVDGVVGWPAGLMRQFPGEARSR